MTDQQLQSLRNLGCEFEEAADLICSQAAEIDALRKFRSYFVDRCEMLYFHFGMEPVELFNACGAAIDAARQS